MFLEKLKCVNWMKALEFLQVHLRLRMVASLLAHFHVVVPDLLVVVVPDLLVLVEVNILGRYRFFEFSRCVAVLT